MVRLLRHLLIPDWVARRAFPAAALEKIFQAISGSERLHRGEIAFAIEGGLPPRLASLPCRRRAEQLFGELGVWDTEENIGVLIYVQLVDRDIEIVADRGIAARVAQAEWEAICREMEAALRADRYEAAALAGIRAVSDLLARHFPPGADDSDEQPNRPVVL